MHRVVLVLCCCLLCMLQTTAQSHVDSLFAVADSLVIIELANKENSDRLDIVYQVQCTQTPWYYTTNAPDLIHQAYQSLKLKSSNDVILCGFNYRMLGYAQGQELFRLDINSKFDCRYAKLGNQHFKISRMLDYKRIKNFLPFRQVGCTFANADLLGCYVESIKSDERMELLEVKTDSVFLFYRYAME